MPGLPVKKNRGVVRAFRLVVTVGAAYWVLGRSESAAIRQVMASTAIGPLVGALGVYLAGQAVSAFRWLQIVRASAFLVGFVELLRDYYIGMFFNLFGPATLGGDLVRSLYLAETSGRRAAALHTVFADRLVGLFWLLAIACVSMAVFGTFSVPAPVVAVAVGLTASLAGGVVVGPWAASTVFGANSRVRDFVDSEIRPLWSNPRLVFEISALSIVFHVIQLGAVVAVGGAAGVDLPWQAYFVFHPLVASLGALPVSVAGLGLREAGYVYFLANVGGAAMPQVVAFSLLWLAVLVTASAVGGVVFLTDRRPLPFAGPFRLRR